MVDPDAARTIFMVLFMVFEPLRLLAGYYGNLREEVRCNFLATCGHGDSTSTTGREPVQVPLLLVLILLSVIPTLPACIYMLVAQYHMDSSQLALQLPQLAFLLASIGFGSHAVRSRPCTLRQDRMSALVPIASMGITACGAIAPPCSCRRFTIPIRGSKRS